MTEKRSSSVLYNKNANPFFPACVAPPPVYHNYPPRAPVLIVFTLAPGALQLLFLAFVASELPEVQFSIVDFTPGLATIECLSWQHATIVLETFNGRNWLDHPISCEIAERSDPDDILGISPITHLPTGSLMLPGSMPSANPYFHPFVPQFYPMEYGYYGANPVPYPYGYYGVLPGETRNSSRRSSSKSLPSGQNSSYKPPPPFVLNLVQTRETQPDLADEAGTQPDDALDDGLIAMDDEEGGTLRVNPRRLFVGNIPFNSTWPALKNFLITRAEEVEPGNSIDILRVEIPMQQPREQQGDVAKLNSYQFLTTLSQQLLGDQTQNSPPEVRPAAGPSRGLSRGFAIVTTANRASLEKLIKLFDNVDFEGRSLTVRFDRFPDFNNYVLQQLFPSNKTSHPSNFPGPRDKPAFLSNLAFERNLFQHKFYYGSAPPAPIPYNSNYRPYYRNQNPNQTPSDPNLGDLLGPLDEIAQTLKKSPEQSESEKARELVNSFASRDRSAV